MKKFLILVALAGCGPIAADVTIGWGATQKIKKTLEMDQKQTDAQTQSQASTWDNIIDVLPIFAAQPSPTPPPPQPPTVRALILEVEATPTPVPTPEIIIRRVPARKHRAVSPCPK